MEKSATLKRRWDFGEDDSSAYWGDTLAQLTSLLAFFLPALGFVTLLRAGIGKPEESQSTRHGYSR